MPKPAEDDEETKVADLMAKMVIAVRPKDSVRLASKRVLDEGIGAVPVLDEDGRPVGLLSQTDLLNAALLGENLSAAELMTGRMIAVHEAATMSLAMETMARERVHRLIVVDEDGHAIGILSVMDVLRWTTGLVSSEKR